MDFIDQSRVRAGKQREKDPIAVVDVV